jgi:integrase
MYKVASQPARPVGGARQPRRVHPDVQVTPRPKAILEVHEFEPVLEHVPDEWRGPVAVGLYAGLREGEIFGLRKLDVDLERGTIMVCRSWEAERTKEGRPRSCPSRPISTLSARCATRGPARVPACRRSRPIRNAIARAGLVTGYEHRCLSAGCGHVAPSQEPAATDRCPSCGNPTLWSKPIPRHVTFHGTRHSFGTAMVRRAGMAVAQKALRDSDVRLTIHTYGHHATGTCARASPRRSARGRWRR